MPDGLFAKDYVFLPVLDDPIETYFADQDENGVWNGISDDAAKEAK